jgi:hypothetical protein
MVSRNETNTARRNETLHDPNALHSYAARQNNMKAVSGSDDVIMSLANAYENQRARQVTEWEQMRRQAVLHDA